MKRQAKTVLEKKCSKILFDIDLMGINHDVNIDEYDRYAVDCVRFYNSHAVLGENPVKILAMYLATLLARMFKPMRTPDHEDKDLMMACKLMAGEIDEYKRLLALAIQEGIDSGDPVEWDLQEFLDMVKEKANGSKE